MKYDLKAMGYNPDTKNLWLMFAWRQTPEGFDYWDVAYSFQADRGYHRSDVQEKLDAMKKQYEYDRLAGLDYFYIGKPLFAPILQRQWSNWELSNKSGDKPANWHDFDKWEVVYLPYTSQFAWRGRYKEIDY